MFRFTIRDVLWLTVVVGLGVALAIEHRNATLAEMAWHHWEEKAQPKPERELNSFTHFSCTSMPLKDMADFVNQMHALPVVLDPDVNGDTPITCKVTGELLRTGLEKMLSPHNLDFRIDNGAIVIQQRQAANSDFASPPATLNRP